MVGLGDGRADQVLVAACGWQGIAAFVLNAGLEVELLLGGFDGRPADAAAVDLLQIEALRVVVVEGGLAEGEEAGGEVLVAFGVGMEDAGFGDGGGQRAGWFAGMTGEVSLP